MAFHLVLHCLPKKKTLMGFQHKRLFKKFVGVCNIFQNSNLWDSSTRGLFKKFVDFLVSTCGSGYLYFWLLGEDLLVGILLGVVVSYLLMILLDLVVVVISIHIIITIVTRILYAGWIFCENIQYCVQLKHQFKSNCSSTSQFMTHRNSKTQIHDFSMIKNVISLTI